jgi:hypothetical protein
MNEMNEMNEQRNIGRATAVIAVALALLVSACSTQRATTTTQPTTTTARSSTTSQLTDDDTDVDDQGATSVDAERLSASLAALPTSTLTEQEITDLLWMREEEKLAHDVYSVLSDTWKLPIFANIAASEQTHTDAVAQLLERYNIDDPADGEPAGVFTNPDLQKAYDDFVARGSQSLDTALTVGAEIEEMDLFDIQQRTTDTPDVALVYANLAKGSRNHLRSFVAQLEQRGLSYTPHYLDQSDYNDIISSPIERGPAA